MQYVTLGKTGITVNKNGFGALPIQRISFDEAAAVLRRAYDGGVRYFDSARFLHRQRSENCLCAWRRAFRYLHSYKVDGDCGQLTLKSSWKRASKNWERIMLM